LVEQMRLLLGFFNMARLLQVVARLGIPGHLAAGPRSSAELAVLSGSHEPTLYRVMRALAGFGVFAEEPERRFRRTAASELLRPGVPGSLYRQAMIGGESWFWQAWGDLPHSLKSGEAAFDHRFGSGFYPYLETQPQAGAAFRQAAEDRPWNPAVLDLCDFSRWGCLVDVGGGAGKFLILALAAQPGMEGLIFDLPGAGEPARQAIRAAGLEARCRFESGDFFASVPAGGDVYLLHSVLLNWPDEAVHAILANCAAAMGAAGALLIIEPVMPPGPADPRVCFADMSNLVLMGGRTRTREEYRELLAAAGLRLAGGTPVPGSPVTILEAVPSPG